MVIKSCKKEAYSIIEVTLVLLIVTIFIALSSNIFASKVKSKTNAEIHGRFECYYKNGKLMQRKFIEGVDMGEEAVEGNHCEFIPNQFVRYIVINIVGGGAAPNKSLNKGGGAGVYKSLFYPSPLYKYYLYPAKASNANNGEDSYVMAISSNDAVEKEVVRATGGSNGKDLGSSSIEDVKSCIVSKSAPWEEYQCGTSAKCEIKDGNIIVSYCRSTSYYKAETLEYNDQTKTQPSYTSIVRSRGIQDSKGVHILDNTNGVWKFYSMSYYNDINCDPLKDPTNNVCKNYKTYFDNNGGLEYFKKMLKDPYELNNATRYPNLTPCMYQLELKIDLTQYDNVGEVSGLTKYAISMNYKGGIADVGAGNGGSVSDTYGKAGGILILY